MSGSETLLLTFGSRTRDFHQAWKSAGHGDRIPEAEIRSFFNTFLDLFPSDSQIWEMVCCARGIEEDLSLQKDLYLSFGEACVLASELQYRSDSHTMDLPLSITTKKRFNSLVETSSNPVLKDEVDKKSNYDVFLGGSCNPTTWRSDLAIPYLKECSLTFYNPQLPNWSPELIQLEHAAKQTSKILFFVLNEQTRNVVSMIEVSYYAGLGRTLITVLGSYRDQVNTLSFNGEMPTSSEIEDLSSGLLMVHDLIERENAPVFKDILRALKCSNQLLTCTTTSQKRLSDYFTDINIVKDGKIKIGDEILRLREAFDSLDTSRNGVISGDDLKMAFRVHTHRDLSQEDLDQIILTIGKDGSVNFDQFCCIVSEFKKKLSSECHLKKELSDNSSTKTSSFYQNFVTPISKLFHRVLSRSPSCSFPTVKYRRRQGTSQCFRSRRGSSMRDVYLGGAIDSMEDDWKTVHAIPLLKKNGLTFFAPKSNSIRRTPIDFHSMDSSRLLFFYIPGRPRFLAQMCEASYYIGQGCNVILCLQPLKQDSKEPISPGLMKDYSRGRSYLSDIANREGIPVFEDLSEGLECLISKSKNSKVTTGNH